MPRCGSGKLDRYGDSMIGSPVGCGDWVVASEGRRGADVDGDGARPHSG